VVKMKRSDAGRWAHLVEQLMNDLQSILRMQLDRRFALGFILGPSELTIWMGDRSGVVGTEAPINIHTVGR